MRWVPCTGQFRALTSLTPGRKTGLFVSLNLVGSSASQWAVWPYMTVGPPEPDQADFRLPAIAVRIQVELLVYNYSPQSFTANVP